MPLQNNSETVLMKMTTTHNLLAYYTLPVDLRTTNQAPSDDELDMARILRSQYEEQISRILALDEQSAGCKRDLVLLQYGLTVLKSVISPIRRVPEDIIRQIFIACVNSEESSYYSSMSRRCAPLLLTHISSGMRHIAIHSPELWRRFDVDMRTSWKTHKAGLEPAMQLLLDKIRTWLHRSQDLPLCIHFTHKLYLVRKQPKYRIGDDIFNLVFSCHYRWEEINIVTAEREPILTSLQSLGPQDVPKLQRISLNYTNDARPIPMPLLSSPVLRRVSGFTFADLNAYWPQFPCSSLTHLDFPVHLTNVNDFNAVVRTLRQCHSLVYLSFSIAGYRSSSFSITESDMTADTIELPRLRFLKAWNEKTMILGLIAAPLLESFYLSGPVLPTIMRPFQSTKHLTVLALDSKINADLFIDALRCCPQLKVLLTNALLVEYDGDKAKSFEDILARFIDIESPICPLLEDFHAFKVIIKRENIFRAFLLRKLEHSLHISRWNKVYIEVTYNHMEPEDPVRAILEGFFKYSPTIRLELRYPDNIYMFAAGCIGLYNTFTWDYCDVSDL